jgi:hypothetical protein
MCYRKLLLVLTLTLKPDRRTASFPCEGSLIIKRGRDHRSAQNVFVVSHG